MILGSLGMMLGGLLGGSITQKLGPAVPQFWSFVGSALAFLIIAIGIPETHPALVGHGDNNSKAPTTTGALVQPKAAAAKSGYWTLLSDVEVLCWTGMLEIRE